MSSKKTNSQTGPQDDASLPGESLGNSEEAASFAAGADDQHSSPISAGSVEVAELQQKLQEAESRIIRGQAELDNFRKRMRREMEDREKFAAESLLQDLLHVADNLQLAIQSAAEANEGGGLLAGVQMVVDQLQGVLAKYHCQKIEALGELFDPNLHAAVQMQPDDKIPANHVSFEVRSGYTLHDRVIRPAQVFVSTGKPE